MPSTSPSPRGPLVGARVKQLESPRLLVGRGRYLDDVRLPGTLEVAFVRSPHAHARIVSIDVSAAGALPGVAAVLTAAEADELCRAWCGVLSYPGMQAGWQRPLARDKVRFVGEPVAAVAASSRALAEDACELVRIEYEPLPAVTDPEAALAPEAPPIHEELGENRVIHLEHRAGDPDAAFAAADLVVAHRFRTNRHTGIPLEGRGLLASFDLLEGSLTVWASTQAPHMKKAIYAELLGLPEHRVRIISPDVGGAFGLKAHIYPEDLAVLVLAIRLGRPVKWAQDRAESLLGDVACRDERIDLAMAFRRDGTLLAMRAAILGDCGAYSVYPRTSLTEPLMVSRIIPGPYRFADYQATVDLAITNKMMLGHFRAVGHPPAILATEGLLDLAARELRIDRLELRRKNLLRPDELPWKSASGATLDSGDYPDTLEQLLREADYGGLLAEQRRARTEGRLLGIGVICFIEGTAPGPQFYGAQGAPIQAADATTVRVEPDGSVTVLLATGGQGQGLRTTAAQVVADELGLGIEDISVLDGDTSTVPYGSGLFGARSGVVSIGATTLAARAVAEKARLIAAHLLEASPDDLELAGRAAGVRGAPGRSIGLREVAQAAYFRTVRLPKELERGLEATRYYEGPPMTFVNGAHLAMVEVDPDTGLVTLLRYVAVDDCGVLINPLIVEGQIEGGVVQGVGGALLEQIVYDADGQLLTGSLLDYLLPLATDVPDVEVGHRQTPTPLTLRGTKGVGETGTSGAPAAILCAVNDALAPLGVDITSQPITPDVVRRAILDVRG